MFDVKKAIEGNLQQRDLVFLTALLIMIAYVLVTLNTTSRTVFTEVYVPMFALFLILYIYSIIAAKDTKFRLLPIASIGFGDMKTDFNKVVAIGIIFGIILAAGAFKVTGSFLEVSVPNLGVTDPAQNVFLSAFVVPIVEEATTAMIFLPSVANLIAQGGTMVLFFLGGSLGFFWLQGYNLFALIIMIGVGIMLKDQSIKNYMAIVAIAIIMDGLFFVVLHTNVYPLQVASDKLMKVFLYRVIGDIIVVGTGSIVPVFIAHSINNAITVSYVSGAWVVSPLIAIAPTALMIAGLWAIKNTNKIKAI